jgi:coproporphyrinogen III oxidase-like Fe-S oxidoreductase
MCNGILVFEDIANQFQISAGEIKKLVKFDPMKFDDFINDGLMVLDGDQIKINDKGFMFARNIAMALDPAYNQGENIYSKTV